MGYSIAAVIILLACAGFAAFIASQKHRDVMGWFILGVSFGPFAIVALVVLPSLAQGKIVRSAPDVLSLLYVLLIILANVFAALWRIPLPFGLMVPAGVFFFAPIFTLRDRIQVDRGVKWVYMLIAISAVVSWLAGAFMGAPLLARVALASVIAFLISETLDTVIFTFLKKSFTQRALWSNFFSAFVDSLIFIGVAFGVVWPLILGQWLVKMIIAAIMIPLVAPKVKLTGSAI